MKSVRFVVPVAIGRRLLGSLALFGGLALAVSPAWAGQESPPIPGVTGTVALEGTLVQESVAANTVIVKTADGVRHVFHFTKNLLIHGGRGGKDAGVEIAARRTPEKRSIRRRTAPPGSSCITPTMRAARSHTISR